MIDNLINTELRELDELRDALPLLFDRDGHALPGFRELDARYDRGLQRLEALVSAGSRAPWVIEAVLDAIDWHVALLEWRRHLLAATLLGASDRQASDPDCTRPGEQDD
jgi:hypothetical protein